MSVFLRGIKGRCACIHFWDALGRGPQKALHWFPGFLPLLDTYRSRNGDSYLCLPFVYNQSDIIKFYYYNTVCLFREKLRWTRGESYERPFRASNSNHYSSPPASLTKLVWPIMKRSPLLNADRYWKAAPEYQFSNAERYYGSGFFALKFSMMML